MEMEFKVLRYPNTAIGQQNKIDELSTLSSRGWSVVSETIQQSDFDAVGAARDAACTCFLCGPFCAPFLMNRTKYSSKGEIVVTLQRPLELKRKEQEAYKQRAEQRRIALELSELEQRANIETILERAKDRIGVFYPNSKIVAAIKVYLETERKPGGPVPSYADSKVGGDMVSVAGEDGQELARYNRDDL